MAPPSLDVQLDQGIAELGLDVPASARARLLDYLALLTRWNATFNLTAVREPAAMVSRHLLDSLAIAPYVRGDTLLDVGSGAGLPGLPLAILEPARRVTLLDTNGKKSRFQREVVRQLGLDNVSVQQQRVETAGGQYDCITARAFASLDAMLALGGHLLAAHGRWLAMKGRYPHDELEQLPPGFHAVEVVPLTVPGIDGERHLVILDRTED